MTSTPTSLSRRFILIPVCCLLLAATLSARPVSGETAGTPYLVRDIDTTGEPYYSDCQAEPCAQIPFYGGQPAQLTSWNDLLFFVANDRKHGFEPWVSDGTAAGTRMLADLCPGDCDSDTFILGPSRHGLLFWAVDGASSCRLWRTDGESVVPVGDVTDDGSSCLSWTTVWSFEFSDILDWYFPSVAFGDFLFFQRYTEPRQGHGPLVRSDGTAAGTEPVFEEPCREPGCPDGVTEFEQTNRGLYFVTEQYGDRTHQLWFLSTPTGAPSLVWEQPWIDNLEPLRGDLLFVGADDFYSASSDPTVLYRTDGTPDGTEPVREFHKVARCPGGEEAAQQPRGLTSLGDQVFFLIKPLCDTDLRLWRTDGTPDGTVKVPGPSGAGWGTLYEFRPFVPVADRLQFGAGPADPNRLRIARLYDVGAAGDVRELLDLPIEELAAAGDRSFFSADAEGSTGAEPWVSDGTVAGTSLLGDLEPGPASSSPHDFVRAGDRIFFTAETEELGRELWAIDLDELPPPQPPYTEWLRTSEVPGFRVQVRITGGGGAIEGRPEASCIPETLCVSGALPGRSEVFVRVVGPKPNGFLWPTLVKFSTSTVEVWIEREATGTLRYYRLEGARPGVDELPGLFDRTGFEGP